MTEKKARQNPQVALGDAKRAYEQAKLASIRSALSETGGNATAAAKKMGVSRATFYRWLGEHTIKDLLRQPEASAE